MRPRPLDPRLSLIARDLTNPFIAEMAASGVDLGARAELPAELAASPLGAGVLGAKVSGLSVHAAWPLRVSLRGA